MTRTRHSSTIPTLDRNYHQPTGRTSIETLPAVNCIEIGADQIGPNKPEIKFSLRDPGGSKRRRSYHPGGVSNVSFYGRTLDELLQ